MEQKKESKLATFLLKHKIIGTSLLSIFFIMLLGVPAALIPNPLIHYIRMAPVIWLDYFFLVSTSILLSINLLVFLDKKTKKEGAMLGGGALGFLSFACATCNVLLVSLLGYTFIWEFIEPLRPVFGVVSIIVLLAALHFQIREQQCATCTYDLS